jgi:hypothetical protein
MPNSADEIQFKWDLIKIGIGFASGSVTPLLIEWAKRVLFRPRLDVNYEKNDSHTPISEESGNTPGPFPAKYLRVSVKNVGNMIAKGCRAYLVKIEEIVGSEAKPTFYHDTLRLRWEYEEDGSLHDGVDIPPGIFVYLDIISCKFENNMNNTFIQVAKVRNKFANKLEFGKLYRFTILVASEAAVPKEINLTVDMGHTWKEFTIVDPKQISISGRKIRRNR